MVEWYFTVFLRIELPESLQSVAPAAASAAEERLAQLEAELRAKLVEETERVRRDAEAHAEVRFAERERLLRAAHDAEISRREAEHRRTLRETLEAAQRDATQRQRALIAEVVAEEQLRAGGGKTSAGDSDLPPWAASNVAKHAAEARARAAESPIAGSARPTIRTPLGAESIKEKIADLHSAIGRIRQLRRDLERNFYEIGDLLLDIRERALYTAKGFASFDGFIERETELGTTTAAQLVRIAELFKREPCVKLGLTRVAALLSALDAADGLTKSAPLPLKPPGRT